MAIFSNWKITTRVFVLNLVFIVIAAAILIVVLASFRNVKSFITSVVDRDINRVVENSAVGKEFTGVFADLLMNLFYGSGDSEQGLVERFARIETALAEKGENPELQSSLENFKQSLGPFLEDSALIRRTPAQFGDIENDFLYNLETLQFVIEEKLYSTDPESDASLIYHLKQLQMMSTRYRESFVNISRQVNGLSGPAGAKADASAGESAIKAVGYFMNELQTLTASESEIAEQGQKLIETLAVYKDKIELFMEVLARFQSRLEDVNSAKEQIMALLNASNRAIADSTEDIKQNIISKTDASENIVTLLIGVLIIVLLIISLFIMKMFRPIVHVVSELRRNYEQLLNTADQVSVSGKQLSDGSSEQAASTEETSASLEGITSTARQNAANAELARQCESETESLINQLNERINKLIESLGSILESEKNTRAIIRKIDDIAFQTRLLALNAAVEAARAGNAGGGFAVVAGEVRNLAVKATESAQNSTDVISETEKRVDESSKLIAELKTSFMEVDTNSKKVYKLINEIAEGSKTQFERVDQIKYAVREIDRVTQQNAFACKQSSDCSKEMTFQAEQIKELINSLQVVIGGRTSYSGLKKQSLISALQSGILK